MIFPFQKFPSARNETLKTHDERHRQDHSNSSDRQQRLWVEIETIIEEREMCLLIPYFKHMVAHVLITPALSARPSSGRCSGPGSCRYCRPFCSRSGDIWIPPSKPLSKSLNTYTASGSDDCSVINNCPSTSS